MDRLDAWADGSSLGNPGPGGWAWYASDQRWRAAGTPGPVTNNRMELCALLDLLRLAPASTPLRIHLDSRYVLDSVTKWAHGWARNGWKTKTGSDVVNVDLIQEIVALVRGRDIEWVWVKGHDGNHGNETVDTKARAAAEKAREIQDKLVVGPGWTA